MIVSAFAPSMVADSSSDSGRVAMKLRAIIMNQALVRPGNMSAHRFSINPRFLMFIYLGIRPPPKNMVNRKKMVKVLLRGIFFFVSGYAPAKVNITVSIVPTTVLNMVFLNPIQITAELKTSVYAPMVNEAGQNLNP